MLDPMSTTTATAPPRFTLVVGSELLLVDRAISAVVAAARKHDPETEVRVIDCGEPGAAGLLAQACSPTLFGTATVVVADHVDSAENDVIAAILDCVSAADGSAIVAVHSGGARGKKQLAGLLAREPVRVDCPDIKRGRALLDFVQSEFRSRHCTIAADAATLLAAITGADVRLLAAACAQLCDDVPQGAITADNVRTYFGSTADVTGFQIADAVLARRPAEALRLVRTAEIGDGAGIGPAAVAAIASGLRQLVKYVAAGPGMSERDMAAAVGAPPWRLRAIADHARRWRPVDVAAAIVMLADADAALKGGLRDGDQLDVAQKSLALEQLINRMLTRQ